MSHSPQPLGVDRPSFGFGDRIGLATPGHVEALRRAGEGIDPLFAQQSIREMTRTSRTAVQVMADAATGVAAEGWSGTCGADADHLKTDEDVDITVAAGFTFFTIDPSGEVDPHADTYSAAEIEDRKALWEAEASWLDAYRGRTHTLRNGTELDFSEEALRRCAIKYGRALHYAVNLAETIDRVNTAAGKDYEIELSVDETEQPTTPVEHWIVAEQCLQRGMKLVSLAPRFVGDFEKGVDVIGDAADIAQSIDDHAAVAAELGPYKLSLHSGSDKLSMYTDFARATKGCFHVKTAGTSYLEALRVAAIEDKALFREICEFSRGRYDVDKATYHVHATLANVPPVEGLSDLELEQLYLERWEDVDGIRGFTEAGRQILHCTFGSVLTHDTLGPAVFDCLKAHPDTYKEVLAVHFAKHLEALQAGL